jgi:hypothetical protein
VHPAPDQWSPCGRSAPPSRQLQARRQEGAAAGSARRTNAVGVHVAQVRHGLWVVCGRRALEVVARGGVVALHAVHAVAEHLCGVAAVAEGLGSEEEVVVVVA